MNEIKNICVLGLGYVGLTLGIALSEKGFNVYGVEINREVVEKLKRGETHFFEANLNDYLKEQLGKNLTIYEKIPPKEIDAFIICVGTPLKNGTRKPNLGCINNVIKEVGKNLKEGTTVILRSTVPVGITRNFILPKLEAISKLKAGKDFYIAFAPERTAEGNAFVELKTLPQIIGGLSEKDVEKAEQIFAKLTPAINKVSSLEAAEMIKLMDNSYRDSIFAYANEIALIAEALNLDVKELIEAANSDYPRNNIPKPSPGVGGGCLTKDSWILAHVSKKKGYRPKLIEQSRLVNTKIPKRIVEKIDKLLMQKNKGISSAKIFIVGFAFKGDPETDDLRDSTTLWLLDELKKKGANIYGFDPVVKDEELEKLGVKVTSIEEGVENADVVMFMNNHKSYSNLNMTELAEKMNKEAIFYDAWRMFDSDLFKNINGVKYLGVGFEQSND